jgi:hypothetical protein
MFPMRAAGEATVNRRRAVIQSASPLQERCGSRGGSCCGRALLLPRKTAAVAVWRPGGGAGKCCVRGPAPSRPARQSRRGSRRQRDDSLFPLGSGPLYLGWDPCYRAAVLPWRPAVRRVGAAKCFVYSDWEALLPNRVITAVSGRLQKILANYATKFAA